LFDNSGLDEWQAGVLIEIDENLEIHYIPIKKNNEFVKMANETDSKIILDEFKKRSNDILNIGFVSQQYKL
jgi:hypothetical protein